jgi:ATP-dependent Lhr-like helicase
MQVTVGNPAEILRWLHGTSRRPGAVVDPPRAKARRELLIVHEPDRAALGRAAASLARGHKSLFFCQSRATTEAVAEELRRAGTPVHVHHSSVSKEERQLAEEQFHRGSDACIVCTSTLELGIDVGDLVRVLQADAPDTFGGASRGPGSSRPGVRALGRGCRRMGFPPAARARTIQGRMGCELAARRDRGVVGWTEP